MTPRLRAGEAGIYFAVPGVQPTVPSPGRPVTVRFGAYELNPNSGELRKHGLHVRLQGQPVAILKMLLDRPGELVTREELQKKLWPQDTFVDFEHSLNAAVKRLRAALNDSAEQPRYIETLTRRGYRFIAPIHGAGSDAGSEPFDVASTKAFPARPESPQHRRLFWIITLTALVLVTGGALAWRERWQRLAASPASAIHALAVLPLENLSGDPSQEYFADGMTDELITDLAQIGSVRIISRTSVMHYKGSRKPLTEIARELGVDGIVEGTVVRSGGRVRITSQLIYAPLDRHLWARSYERDSSDVLGMQNEIAEAIAGEIRATIAPEQRTRLLSAKSVDPLVYENYLRGRFALYQNTRASLEQSISFFEKAIETDPTFAPAYVGLASAHANLSLVFIGAVPQKERPKAISAARKALELDPNSAEAHAVLADVLQKQWQWAASESEYRRAIESNPNNAAAYEGLARWMVCQGHTDEALAWARRGRQIDPLEVSGADIGWILFLARRYDDAIREMRAELAVKPNDPFALWYLGFVLVADGKPQQAVPVLEKALSVSNRSPGVMGVLVNAYSHAGRRAAALRLLDELEQRHKNGYVPAAAFVNAYLGLERREQVFVWLEQAYKEQSNILQWLKVHPFFDPIRNDRRFDELLRRINLSP